LVAAAKFLAAATKNLFVVSNFVAVTKPFFFRESTLELCAFLLRFTLCRIMQKLWILGACATIAPRTRLSALREVRVVQAEVARAPLQQGHCETDRFTKRFPVK